MCGICGIIHHDLSRPVDREVLAAMNRTLVRRGPDDEGFFLDQGAGLAMRRLSIIDVSGGQQPMISEDGSIVAVCNGELYNFQSIREELEAKGHVFTTRSDAEILPHLYEEEGADFVARLNGMFGLALWDKRTRTLLIARDRMGQKPLYWTQQEGRFLFGSELKAILAHPSVDRSVDRANLAKYLAYEYVPAPHTICEGIFKLEPGQLLVLRDGVISTRFYWDVPTGYEAHGITVDEAAEELTRLMALSVQRRLLSDVPLGLFLSGGLDSSSICAMMARFMPPQDIKSFSIAFSEKSFDESSFARQVAEHFGTDHRERTVTPAELQGLLPEVMAFLDEPLGDASIIPTFALARFTREHVTVALGGDGGDELFAGYPTFQAEKYAATYRRLPAFLRRGCIEPIARRLPVSDENISFDFKVKQFLKGANIEAMARHFFWMGSFAPAEQATLLAFDPHADIFDDLGNIERRALTASPGNRLLYAYMKLYLAEDILTKVDRASMGCSLEARAPFLDHEVVEFVARLPYAFKLHGTTMKYLLKKAMDPLLPKGIAHRSKKGFGIPVAKWVKGPLKSMVCDLFAPDKIRREGFFRPEAIASLLDDHFAGRVDNRKKIWTLLIFEQWLERWG